MWFLWIGAAIFSGIARLVVLVNRGQWSGLGHRAGGISGWGRGLRARKGEVGGREAGT